MIWRPEHNIILPGRRTALPFEHGLIMLDSSGKRLLNSSGKRAYDCGGLFIQLKKCSDDSDQDAWFPYREVGGVKQVLVVGWETLPCYVTKAGVKYYFSEDNNIDTTPGTAGSGYTITTTCATCLACIASSATSVLVTLSGITQPCLNDGTFSYQIIGNLNGTYTLPLVSGSCFYSYTIPQATAKVRKTSGTSCSGFFVGDFDVGALNVNLNVSAGQPMVYMQTTSFSALRPTPTWNCKTGSVTVNNSITSAPTGVTVIDPYYGGTAVVTAL